MSTTVVNRISTVATRPLVVHQVTPWPLGGLARSAQYDLRTVRLRIMTSLLGASVASLDCVRDARNLADLEHCPVCGPGPRAVA